MSGVRRCVEPPAPEVRLGLLGAFSLHCAGAPVTVPSTGQRVLAYLALHPRGATRRELAGALWLDGDDRRAATNLRSSLCRLPQPAGQRPVQVGPTGVRLDPDVHVDVWELDAFTRELSAGGDAEADVVPDGGAVLDWAADLLPGWHEDWLQLERERVRQLRLHALEQLCAAYCRNGDHAAALAAGFAAAAAEPLRESAHRQVIRVHLAEGNAVEALREYDGFRRLLWQELHLTPSPAMQRLVAPLLEAGRYADATRQSRGAATTSP